MSKQPSFIESAGDGTVTVTTVHENTDMRDFAARRAQQLEELIKLAEDCGVEYCPLVTMLVGEVGREVAALLRAVTGAQVQRA
ncbi:hypothetical protein BLA18112_03855 [Burkholderia lata]|uniref:Uncharacterized protein n=1 Tax=Burkholderia lata (strain ATCC 17760 / DSM 23089 / LMG 22485 / NCIMB 9086 / R18194 / 383) TaxID=482957 RepID=A0A6P2WQM1_BURL3|nr:hypothetical protein [Burkholderia lata]VWC98999.1 hypothetical protein BLA18112_03855 [Burkholderia lata]